MSNTNGTNVTNKTKAYTPEEIVKPFIKELFVSEENNSTSKKRKDPKIDHRYRAFDICHSYFYKNCHPKKKILDDKLKFEGCMVLYSFLANWGMIQKVAPLMQTNVRGLRGIIDFIYKDQNQFLWNVDIDGLKLKPKIEIKLDHYLPEAIKVEEKEEQKKKVKKWKTILGEIAEEKALNPKKDSEWKIKINNHIDALAYCFNEMAYIIAKEGHFVPTSTLITKIMLGVYGNTPAFDRFVRKTLDVFGLHEEQDYTYLNDSRSGFEAVLRLVKGEETEKWKVKWGAEGSIMRVKFCKNMVTHPSIPVIDFQGFEVKPLYYKIGKWADMFAFEYGKKIEELEEEEEKAKEEAEKKAKEEAEKILKQNA